MLLSYLARMKQWLFTLLLSLTFGRSQAQSATPVTTAFPYRYAVLVADDRYFSARNRLTLDYGQGVEGAIAEPEMAEMATNIRGSTSAIDALNYLARHGWELLSVTNVPSEGSSPATRYIDSETRYLHRRRVTTP